MRKSELIRRITGFVLLGFLLSLGFLQPVKDYLSMPKHSAFFQGDTQKVGTRFPGSTIASVENNKAAASKMVQAHLRLRDENMGKLAMLQPALALPARKVDAHVLPDLRLIPGGESIGVKLNTLGVLVVGYHLIHAENGEKSPGETAGVQVGDVITKINKIKIGDMSDVKRVLNQTGSSKPLSMTILRRNVSIQKTLVPVKDTDDNHYRMGLYIRDSAAGIGTLTFYDPQSGRYGALGHVISDIDTRQPIVVNSGKIVRSTVNSIDKGKDGNPGEKIASFPNNAQSIGTINKNTPFGIYGRLNQDLNNGMMEKGLPIALSNEVKEGPAKILTVLNGSKVQAFDIKILSSLPQKFPATKGLVIKITDPTLLRETGGIVQGMSGSPIIQNGKLIGAVTHVFVNDPTSGYGVHIEWMLQEAGINIYQKKHIRRAVS